MVRKGLSRAVTAVFLLLMTALPTVNVSAASRSSSRAGEPDWSDRYIMFISGICPEAFRISSCAGKNTRINPQAREQTDFGDLQTALNGAGVSYHPLYYSYFIRKGWSNSNWYYASDTHETLDVAAYQLETQLRAVVRHDANATFDLIGHSLGGVIAAYWVTKYADAGMLARIHGVITFDSPLQGIVSGDAAIGVVASGSVWQELLPDSQEIQAINDGTSGTVAQLTLDNGDVVASSDGPGTGNNLVYTINNGADTLIPPQSATMAGVRDNETINDCALQITDLLDQFVCHSSVLHNADALNYAVGYVESGITPVNVSLTVDNGSATTGDTVNLTAQTNQDISGSNYAIDIIDQSSEDVLTSCDAQDNCSTPVSLDSVGSDSYVAEIIDGSGNSFAQSDPVSVTWNDDTGSSGDTGTGNLGPVDLNSYCQSQGYAQAYLDGDTANDWYCADYSDNLTNMDMDAACQWQYSDPNASAVMGDVNDPYSWTCQDAAVAS